MYYCRIPWKWCHRSPLFLFEYKLLFHIFQYHLIRINICLICYCEHLFNGAKKGVKIIKSIEQCSIFWNNHPFNGIFICWKALIFEYFYRKLTIFFLRQQYNINKSLQRQKSFFDITDNIKNIFCRFWQNCFDDTIRYCFIFI